MSVFKYSCLILTFSICIISCKGPNYTFRPENVTSELWKSEAKLSELDGGHIKVTKINKVYVYSADLAEIMVEQKGITNYQVVNKNSTAYKTQKLPVNGYSHKLYLLVFLIEPKKKPSPVIFFSTSFNKNGRCIGIDPIYIGELNDLKMENDVFLTRRYLKIKENDNQFEFARTKKDSVDIRFEADNPLVPTDSLGEHHFTFIEVTQGYNNTITGKEKKIIYQPGKIFSDTSSLYFKLEKVILP